MERPIPAAYYVYALRSRSGRARPYVGSTPHPPRRLAQHNGYIVGGATKTRNSGRPWTMLFVVSGFASKIAALQFEWALGNYHLTNFIPTQARLVLPDYKKKKSGAMPSGQKAAHLYHNLHLLLRVKGFSRWPLSVQFLRIDAYDEWQRVTKDISPPLNSHRRVFLSPHCVDNLAVEESKESEPPENTRGKVKSSDIPLSVRSLEVTYDPIRLQVKKSTELLQNPMSHSCQICNDPVNVSEQFAMVCPQLHCTMVAHMTCLSARFLAAEGSSEELLPTIGSCPRCCETISWQAMMKDLSLRSRGSNDLAKLLKEPKTKTAPASEKDEAVGHGLDDDQQRDAVLSENNFGEMSEVESDFEDVDAVSTKSEEGHTLPPLRTEASPRSGRNLFQGKQVIANSDWDDIEQFSE